METVVRVTEGGPLPAWPAWASLLVVLYATLLPFQFDPGLSLAAAWERYLDMELGPLRPRARQEWVANAALFFPLGFFWSAWLAGRAPRPGRRLAVGTLVALLAACVTASVEFVQAWIPLRAPSLIDMSGNFAGGVAGMIAWFAVGPRFPGWLRTLRENGLASALNLYVVLYVLYALMPFDLVLSVAEWQEKVAGGQVSLWVADASCGGGSLRCLAQRTMEGLLAVPLGFWLVQVSRHRAWAPGFRELGAVGLAAGIEVGQAAMLSGVAEGLAVLLRGAGIMAGLALPLGRVRLAAGMQDLRRRGRRAVVGLAGPYVLLLLGIEVGLSGLDWDTARMAQALGETRLLPFHYHYLVAQSAAISSIMQHVIMYVPVGIAAWLGFSAALPGARGMRLAMLAAALMALLVETAKLLVPGRHPDYTDVLIAAGAALLGWMVCAWVWQQLSVEGGSGAPAPVPSEGSRDDEDAAERPAEPRSQAGRARLLRVLSVCIGAFALWKAAAWPLMPQAVLAALLAYAVLLWRFPGCWLLVVPALMPVLSLSHLSGRFFLDELDLVVLVTLAVGFWRHGGRGWPRLPRAVGWSLGAFSISAVGGVLVALHPWQAPTLWDWTHYTSTYHALRIGKGFLWGLLLFLLMGPSGEAVRGQVRDWLIPGMALGLAGGLGMILRERMLYPGLLDFESTYRIAGGFGDMHVGGPSVEAWLVMAAGFALLWGRRDGRGGWPLMAGIILFVGALYALAVTYSRGGYLGFLVWTLIALAALGARVVHHRHPAGRRLRLAAGGLLIVGAGVVVVTPIAGGFADQRLAEVEADLERRLGHWRLATALAASSGPNLFGQGLGSFPRAYLFGNPAQRVPANFRVTEPGEDGGLVLGGGDSLYINQRLHLRAGVEYTLSVKAAAEGSARLGLFVCEKYLRYAYGCRWEFFTIGTPDSEASREVLTWVFVAPESTGPPGLRRTVSVAFAHTGGSAPIELTEVRLQDPSGQDRIRNGDFSAGMDHWYMSTDNLWPWRIENQWLEVWFDLGWVGLFSFGALLLTGLGHLGARALRGDVVSGFFLASLGGALTVGLFGTVFWSPRITMLFFLLLLAGLAADPARSPKSAPVASRDPASRAG